MVVSVSDGFDCGRCKRDHLRVRTTNVVSGQNGLPVNSLPLEQNPHRYRIRIKVHTPRVTTGVMTRRRLLGVVARRRTPSVDFSTSVLIARQHTDARY